MRRRKIRRASVPDDAKRPSAIRDNDSLPRAEWIRAEQYRGNQIFSRHVERVLLGRIIYAPDDELIAGELKLRAGINGLNRR